MKVICTNDSNLPEGAELVKGKQYEVEDQFNNHLDQRTFIIKGINNSGRTKFGMVWEGYKAERFQQLSDSTVEEMVEHLENYVLN